MCVGYSGMVYVKILHPSNCVRICVYVSVALDIYSIGSVVARHMVRRGQRGSEGGGGGGDGGGREAQWLFRLDKEEFTMSLISVLRSNVLRLLISLHDPKQFMAAQTASRGENTSSSPLLTPSLSPSLTHLSALVIDLTPPRFTTHFNHIYSRVDSIIDPDIQFFLPALNPIQLHFLQRLQPQKSSNRQSTVGQPSALYAGSQNTFTRQFYEASPPPCYAGCHPLHLLQEYKRLNSGQQNVVKKVIASLDYTLLLGMPGSGKTSTLSFVIRTLVARGEQVLITSYTNAAVDNLMNKLREAGVTPAVMGRLGHVDSLDSSMTEYAVLDSHNPTSTRGSTPVV